MKTTYAFNQDGKIVSIREVASGKKCNCYCISCNDKLIAKKGLIKEHHFAHINNDCKYSAQTVIHYLAKQLIEDNNIILFPKLFINSNFSNSGPSIELIDQELVNPTNILLEKRLDNIIPDIIIEIGKEIFFIEIFVTHRIDNIKYDKIKQLGISTIEIDLSSLVKMSDLDDLVKYLFEDSQKSKWIYHSLSDKIYSQIEDLCKIKIVKNGYTSNCPKNNNNPVLTDTCFKCDSRFNLPKKRINIPSIACVYDYKEEIIEVLKNHGLY